MSALCLNVLRVYRTSRSTVPYFEIYFRWLSWLTGLSVNRYVKIKPPTSSAALTAVRARSASSPR